MGIVAARQFGQRSQRGEPPRANAVAAGKIAGFGMQQLPKAAESPKQVIGRAGADDRRQQARVAPVPVRMLSHAFMLGREGLLTQGIKPRGIAGFGTYAISSLS